MNNTDKVKKQRTGFTLVELLVVIAIIGILASMLMPAINSARESARSAQCGSNVRNLAVASNSYAQQNKDRLPAIGSGTGSGFVQLMPYLEMSNMFDTITAATVDGGGGSEGGLDDASHTNFTVSKIVPIFVCPSALDGNVAGQSNFAHNAGAADTQFATSSNTTALRGAFHPSQKTSVATMARDGLMNTIFYSEQRADGNVAATNIEGGAFHAGNTPNQQTTAGTAIDTTSEHHAHSNHPGGVNAAFGDAHVSFYSNDVSTTHWQGLSTANGGENEFAGSE
jgi:prepilin-type N-terminal cleavage/methylation domain-containing protein/prepilin-type processing-associated H-X9-DG protein